MAGVTPTQSKVAAALWLAQPVTPAEAALISLQIPIVAKSRAVHRVGSAPPDLRMHTVLRGMQCCRAPVEKYMARPASLGTVTFCRCVRP
jgi:hypothetical protein